MCDKIFVPPIKIQGIKTEVVPLIKPTVSLDDDAIWIEPFMGSAVVGLNIAPNKAIFSDINPHIVKFYNQLNAKKITPIIVREFLEEEGAILTKKGGEHYYAVRERFNKEHNPLDFLFLNRSCFNGMIRFNKKDQFNVPFGHKPERFAKAYVTKIVNQVANFANMMRDRDWTFLCQPFERTLELAANENTFVYCDPPYIGRHVDYYDSWDEEQEVRLKECLLASGARFMLSTWDYNKYRSNPYIESIWGDCNKITHEHFYFVGARESNRNSMIEALLTNYDVPAL
ncbi:MAG: Dam family site-specific DNA-(adenine-N6)-methyltransferase [Defluviitaleaceae bacterium]|nr:Dam family site-specific DNA-(adenine-N6)-methyltransferase [Defluviitaleaceae bacterium]